MGKRRLLIILSFAYGAVVSVLFYFMLYLISFTTKMNFEESLFLIALFLILIGIGVLISRTPKGTEKPILSRGIDELIFNSTKYDYSNKSWPGKLLLGVNGLSLVLSGIYLLLVDFVLK